jgi:hypothetical protein
MFPSQRSSPGMLQSATAALDELSWWTKATRAARATGV